MGLQGPEAVRVCVGVVVGIVVEARAQSVVRGPVVRSGAIAHTSFLQTHEQERGELAPEHWEEQEEEECEQRGAPYEASSAADADGSAHESRCWRRTRLLATRRLLGGFALPERKKKWAT